MQRRSIRLHGLSFMRLSTCRGRGICDDPFRSQACGKRHDKRTGNLKCSACEKAGDAARLLYAPTLLFPPASAAQIHQRDRLPPAQRAHRIESDKLAEKLLTKSARRTSASYIAAAGGHRIPNKQARGHQTAACTQRAAATARHACTLMAVALILALELGEGCNGGDGQCRTSGAPARLAHKLSILPVHIVPGLQGVSEREHRKQLSSRDGRRHQLPVEVGLYKRSFGHVDS